MAKRVSYEMLTTMNAWQAAAIEKALRDAIDAGTIHKEHGERTLEEFRRFSQSGCVIKFRGN